MYLVCACAPRHNESIKTLLQHYGRELTAESVLSDEFVMPTFVSPGVATEWKTFQPKEDMSE